MHARLVSFLIATTLTTHALWASQPNFLFIIADDCTHRDLGCYGGQANTPNIDQLANDGMRFTQCFQAAPMCSPTRHTIYTGLYPVTSGAYPNHTFVKKDTQSVVHYLKPLGYRVALSGKTHIAPRKAFPFEYSGVDNNPDIDAIDQLIGECKTSDQPFCLFACSNEPHSPWNKGDKTQYKASEVLLPDYFVDTPETRTAMVAYLAEVTYFDWQVGQMLKLLDKHQVADNTVVVVVSEQGSSFPFGKWTCYDTGIQSACVIRWPGRVKAGTTSDAMIEYVDFLPTFIEAAGETPAEVIQGRSFLPVLEGKADTHKDYVFAEMTTRGINQGSPYYGIRSVRNKNYKFIMNFTPEVAFKNACTESDIFRSWELKANEGDKAAADKVYRYQHRPGEELYNVNDDPYELNNVAGDPQLSEIRDQLKMELEAWMKRCGDQGQQTELEALSHQRRGAEK